MLDDVKEPALAPVGDGASPAVAEVAPEPAAEAAPPPESIEDLKAQIATVREEKERLERDLKSLKGTRGQQAKIDQAIDNLASELKGLRAAQTAFARGLTSGDMTGIHAEVQKIDESTAAQRSQARSAAIYERMVEQLHAANQGPDGKPIVANIFAAPEMAEQIAAWNLAAKQGDLMGVQEALIEATGQLRSLERSRARQAEADAKKARADAKKKQREATGDLDRALPGAGAPAGVETLAQLASMDTRGKSLQWLEEYDKKLEAAMRRGR